MQSRGIVTLAGGPQYFLNAYINCKLLREMGCQLPIEWFHLTDEMPQHWMDKVIEIGGITLIDLKVGQPNKDNTKGRGGWQNKPRAIINSSFDEVLWLDADCFPLKDPTYLFDHPIFQDTDCVLYPDPYDWTPEKLAILREVFGVPTLPALQVESGQMLFKRLRCMDGLQKCLEINQNSEIVYNHYLFGDKDSFIIGMLQAGCNFKVNPYQCDGMSAGAGMLHKDFDGNRLFMHLAGSKWTHRHPRALFSGNDYPHLKRAMEIAREAMNIIKGEPSVRLQSIQS